jgi:putative endonuclease
MAFFCYLLECADGTYYCGWTKDVQHRVEMHNKGLGAKYTRMRRPVALVYYEELDSQSEAMQRERSLKQKTHEQKSRLIHAFSEIKHE